MWCRQTSSVCKASPAPLPTPLLAMSSEWEGQEAPVVGASKKPPPLAWSMSHGSIGARCIGGAPPARVVRVSATRGAVGLCIIRASATCTVHVTAARAGGG